MPVIGSCFKVRLTMKKLPVGIQTFSKIIEVIQLCQKQLSIELY